MKRLILISLLTIVVQLSEASAQGVTYDGCRDFRGIEVASVPSNVNNVAVAALAQNGAPVIYYNPQVLSYFHPVTQEFWYLHECAHHALAHTIGSAHPFVREKAADCWAIHTMYRVGALNRQTIRTFPKFRDLMSRSP